MNAVFIFLAAVAGYLLGSVNTSLVVSRFYGIDIRKRGSGNAGMTNVLRSLGKTAALAVLAGDVVKGVMSYIIGLYTAGELGAMAAGAAAVLGHNWPLYFGFKGGKGALTSISVVFMMDWKIGLIILGLFVLIVAASRYVSLGSILGAASFPVLAVVFNKDPVFIAFALFLGLLAILRHHSNIKRLIKGVELRLGEKNETNKNETNENGGKA